MGDMELSLYFPPLLEDLVHLSYPKFRSRLLALCSLRKHSRIFTSCYKAKSASAISKIRDAADRLLLDVQAWTIQFSLIAEANARSNRLIGRNLNRQISLGSKIGLARKWSSD